LPLQLKNPAADPYEQIDDIGLAFKWAPPFVHVGFLYRDEEHAIRLSHLAFHHKFRGRDLPDDTYRWLEPVFHEILQEQLAARLVQVAEENAAGDIPYSIVHRSQTIDAQEPM
jgi:hypothetical protein